MREDKRKKTEAKGDSCIEWKHQGGRTKFAKHENLLAVHIVKE